MRRSIIKEFALRRSTSTTICIYWFRKGTRRCSTIDIWNLFTEFRHLLLRDPRSPYRMNSSDADSRILESFHNQIDYESLWYFHYGIIVKAINCT